jgi:2,5-diketo-D-gluconate reductase B
MHNVEANGASKPAIGLGTWEIRGALCVDNVAEGLKIGYRHVDTAQAYANEREVGEGIRASGVPRSDIFVTTKVWHDALAAGPLEASVEESLKQLDLDYVDLLLIHWPNSAVPMEQTFGALSRVRRKGLTKHIGISNFTIAQIEEAVAISEEPIVTNQIEFHPYIDQTKVVEACRRHGISVTAYCPIARGRVVGDAVIEAIAKKHGRTAAQVTLRWIIQQDGLVAIPRTSSKARLAENLDLGGFQLSDDEMAEISDLSHPHGRVVTPAWAPQWD